MKKTILRSLTGSRAYGTATEDSDYDWITAHVRDQAYYLGCKSEVRLSEAIQEGDVTDHEIRHFVGMCCKFNPNIIVALWSPSIYLDERWEWLQIERHLFNSKKAITTFLGFATGQIKQAGGFGALGRLGTKRKALIEKYGFDPKFMYHAIRVASMINEFVDTGGKSLKVDRSSLDSSFLLDVRNGLIPLDECQGIFNEIKQEIQYMETRCDLPDEPDYDTINERMIESMKATL